MGDGGRMSVLHPAFPPPYPVPSPLWGRPPLGTYAAPPINLEPHSSANN
jgi:hypothetical protein